MQSSPMDMRQRCPSNITLPSVKIDTNRHATPSVIVLNFNLKQHYTIEIVVIRKDWNTLWLYYVIHSQKMGMGLYK